MDSAPPPSYDEVVKGLDPSAPPLAQGQPAGQGPHEGAPYPPSQHRPYGQPAYPPGPPQGPAGPQPHPSSMPTGYAHGVQPPPQGAVAGYPQYTYIPVQAGYTPASGYQYTPGQPTVNPVAAGYQTTPLAYGNAASSSSDNSWNVTLCIVGIFIVVCVMVAVIAVVLA